MLDLKDQSCVVCRSTEPAMTEAEIREFHPQIPDWNVIKVDGIPRLDRTFTFKDFTEAMEFTNRVGAIAEAQDHHPRLVTEWGRVTVQWWTHSIKGLHRNDFIMAARTDQLA